MPKKIHAENAKVARDELYVELHEKLKPCFVEGFESIYKTAVESSSRGDYDGSTLKAFQYFLKNIPNWSNMIIEKETMRLKEAVRRKCAENDEQLGDRWFEDIVASIFIASTVILESVKLKGHHGNINLKLPDTSSVIQKIYIECAEEIYYDPYMFVPTDDIFKTKQNEDKISDIIEDSIRAVIQRHVPRMYIIKEYTGGISNNIKTVEDIISSSEEDEPESIGGDEEVEEDYTESESDADDELDTEEKIIPRNDTRLPSQIPVPPPIPVPQPDMKLKSFNPSMVPKMNPISSQQGMSRPLSPQTRPLSPRPFNIPTELPKRNIPTTFLEGGESEDSEDSDDSD